MGRHHRIRAARVDPGGGKFRSPLDFFCPIAILKHDSTFTLLAPDAGQDGHFEPIIRHRIYP